MPDGFRVELDTTQWDNFVRQAPGEVQNAAKTFYQQGSLIMRRAMIEQAVKRFGRETVQSRMQSYDPSRPKGQWAASVEAQAYKGGVAVGSPKPYSWWVERGRRAPKGVPSSHADSEFIGHRPVERGAQDSVPHVARSLVRIIEDALERAAT